MLAVMNPKKVKDVRQLASAVEDWECKVKVLGNEHDITVDDKIMVAVLTSMCPEGVQNFIFQRAGYKARFLDIRDMLMALSQNRSAEMRPKPMEVDNVREDHYYQYKDYEDAWGEEATEEVEVDYVGESCRRCGGMGDYARECPTPTGKGKDVKGGGKGYKGYGVRGLRQGRRLQRRLQGLWQGRRIQGQGQGRLRWQGLRGTLLEMWGSGTSCRQLPEKRKQRRRCGEQYGDRSRR
jgi:hypothetical protein